MHGLISADHGERVHLAIDLGKCAKWDSSGQSFSWKQQSWPNLWDLWGCQVWYQVPRLMGREQEWNQVHGLDFPEEKDWLRVTTINKLLKNY